MTRRGKDDRTNLIQRVRAIIAEYGTMRLTLRQIYYRLVASQFFANALSSYQWLSRELVDARKRGYVPFEAIEDRTRGLEDGYVTRFGTTSVANRRYSFTLRGDVSDRDAFTGFYDLLRTLDENYELPLWWKQPKFVQVWVEKQALAALFEEVTSPEGVDLAVCRGYPSLTFLWEAANVLRENVLGDIDERKIEILYFGDFDPSGADIERYVGETLVEFGLSANVTRVAITREQIDEYEIPPAPAKTSDARYASFVEREGVAWQVELDAIEPRTLQTLIRDAILGERDASALGRRTRELRRRRARIRTWIDEALNDDFETPREST